MSFNSLITFYTVSLSQSFSCRLLKYPIRGSEARLLAPDWTVFVIFLFSVHQAVIFDFQHQGH